MLMTGNAGHLQSDLVNDVHTSTTAATFSAAYASVHMAH